MTNKPGLNSDSVGDPRQVGVDVIAQAVRVGRCDGPHPDGVVRAQRHRRLPGDEPRRAASGLDHHLRRMGFGVRRAEQPLRGTARHNDAEQQVRNPLGVLDDPDDRP